MDWAETSTLTTRTTSVYEEWFPLQTQPDTSFLILLPCPLCSTAGHVGVYYRVSFIFVSVRVRVVCRRLSSDCRLRPCAQGGALLDGIYQPGFHFMVPFITSFRAVQVGEGSAQWSVVSAVVSSAVLHLCRLPCRPTRSAMCLVGPGGLMLCDDASATPGNHPPPGDHPVPVPAVAV